MKILIAGFEGEDNSAKILLDNMQEEKEVWYNKDLISFGYSENFYYNIYGIKIWPYLSEYEHISE